MMLARIKTALADGKTVVEHTGFSTGDVEWRLGDGKLAEPVGSDPDHLARHLLKRGNGFGHHLTIDGVRWKRGVIGYDYEAVKYIFGWKIALKAAA